MAVALAADTSVAVVGVAAVGMHVAGYTHAGALFVRNGLAVCQCHIRSTPQTAASAHALESLGAEGSASASASAARELVRADRRVDARRDGAEQWM